MNVKRIAELRRRVPPPPRRNFRLCFSTGNRLTLLETGNHYFDALIARADAAVRDILLETYIFCDDAAGQAVAAALTRAAQRGVNVRLITDGVGTKRLPLFEQCVAAGVQHRIYNPHVFGRFGFSRTHRKLAVVDGQYGYVGGINIVDDFYNDGQRLAAPRWDFAIEMQGPVVRDIAAAFETQWRRIAVGHKEREPRPRRDHQMRYVAPHTDTPEPRVAFVARDNFRARRAIEKAYLSAIAHAKSEIMLANPYFAPGRRLRRALNHAAGRGVRVRLLIGRKEFVALDYAVPFLYGSLLKAGVLIAEYDKTLLHGKIGVIDGEWATVGSSNLDALSLVLNNEANVVIVNHAQIERLREALLAAFAEARPIDPEHYAARPWNERLLNRFAYSAYRWTMKLLTIGEYD